MVKVGWLPWPQFLVKLAGRFDLAGMIERRCWVLPQLWGARGIVELPVPGISVAVALAIFGTVVGWARLALGFLNA